MLIRRALEKDIRSLAAIEAAWPDYPAWGERGLREELSKPASVTLVAEAEGEAAGFVNFWIVRPEVQINSLAVSPDFLRRGAARALLGKCLEYAGKSDCRVLALEVGENNAPARALYVSFGFRVVGRRPKFYNNAEDALLMSKALPAAGENL